MLPIRLLICSDVIVGRSTALVAGILVSSAGLSEMNFNFCASFIMDLKFTNACFTTDSE